MKKVLAVLAVLAMAGCATININKPSVCDKPEAQDSVICELAGHVGQTPETVAGILKISNIAALAGNLYTAQEAEAFIDEAIEHLIFFKDMDTLTYVQVVKYTLQKLSLLSPEAMALFVILDGFTSYDFGEVRLLTDFDIDMLVKHLNDQKLILAPFLVK